MNKRSIAMTAALLVVVLIAGISPAQAHKRRPAPQTRPAAQTSLKTINVQSHYTEPAGSFDGAQCAGLTTVKPKCGTRFVGPATFTGTIWGDEYYDLTGADPTVLPTGKVTYEGAGYFTGGIVGCGTGTFIIDATEGYFDMSKYDPLTDSAPGYNKWQLRPGSGTGELTNLVSGSGVVNWTVHPLGLVGITPVEGEGDLTGTITCRR